MLAVVIAALAVVVAQTWVIIRRTDAEIRRANEVAKLRTDLGVVELNLAISERDAETLASNYKRLQVKSEELMRMLASCRPEDVSVDSVLEGWRADATKAEADSSFFRGVRVERAAERKSERAESGGGGTMFEDTDPAMPTAIRRSAASIVAESEAARSVGGGK